MLKEFIKDPDSIFLSTISGCGRHPYVHKLAAAPLRIVIGFQTEGEKVMSLLYGENSIFPTSSI